MWPSIKGSILGLYEVYSQQLVWTVNEQRKKQYDKQCKVRYYHGKQNINIQTLKQRISKERF